MKGGDGIKMFEKHWIRLTLFLKGRQQ